MRTRCAVVWGLVLLFGVLSAASETRLPLVSVGALAWSPDRAIGWQDFQAEPPQGAEAGTQTAAIHMTLSWHLTFVVEYVLQTECWKTTINTTSLEVKNTMDPSQSWVVSSMKRDDILNHEQGHFDLNEVYRRKLFSALSRLTIEGATAEIAKKMLQEKIHATADQIFDKLKEMQDRYDEETAHGADQQGQLRWDANIAYWLVDPNQAP